MEKNQQGQPPPSYASDQQYPPQQQQQYPPQQHQYPMHPQQQQPQSVHQVIVTGPVKFDRDPVTTRCQHCQTNITTVPHLTTGLVPWLICGGLILFGCWLGCCIIPFCIKELKDVEHKCPNCHQLVGKHKLLDM